jgi:hypothetical protein
MSYIDLTEAYKSDSWTERVAACWESFGHGWQMQGGTWDKGYSIPAGHWKNSPRIDVPAVINRLTLRGGEFEFEFHADLIKICRIRRPSKRFDIFFRKEDSPAPALPTSALEVYNANKAKIGRNYKTHFSRLWEQLISCVDRPIEIEDMHQISGYEE